MSQLSPASEGAPATDVTATAVLVHGAFSDASSWAGVIAELQAAGVPVRAVASPLRSLSGDSAYVASVATQVAGPVLLVGHSYGGAVIANAATHAPNVVGLAFVAAFIPDEGESLLALAQQATDSLLGPALRPTPYPIGQGQAPGTEFYVDEQAFREVVAADLPPATAAVLAVSQRPAADAAFAEPSGPVGWKTLPSWAIVAASDKVIGPSGERLMAQRAGAQVVEIEASHLVMVSQPTAVADVIRGAASSAARSPKELSGVG